MPGPPDDDAYGRVTNPGRFVMVQHEARRLIEELRGSFELDEDVARPDDPVLDAGTVEFYDAVHLVPVGDGCSTVTVAFSTFPGVFLRWGRWQLSAYPGCGCDGCDEDPAEVSALLRADVEAITAGRVVEEWDGSWLWTEVVHEDGSSGRGGSLREHDLGSFGEPRRHEWQPWRRLNARAAALTHVCR